MDLAEATIGVSLARKAIETAVNSGKHIEPPDGLPAVFDEFGGVFVTLHSGALRGCVGYPYPSKTVKEALIDAAISAALHDYRFPPVTAEELALITIEITLLTEPQKISGPAGIVVGKHGVIVRKGPYQGLLLPQVAVECNWTQQQFLEQTYVKACLNPHEHGAEIFVFEGQIFFELRPGGEVKESFL
jgi:AmmeMemoRadiSam system protein A